ncbi:MAG TPA: PAS domain S-box protein, partial [Methylocystis sp.]|nr:PAS domain S-box protein [Methylocystis sp.]
NWVGLSIFLASAAIISGAGELLHRARSRADQRAADKDRLQIVNERLRLAMSAGAIGAWDFDAVANSFDASQQMREIFGLSPDMSVDLNALFAAVLPEDRPAATEAFWATLHPARDGRYSAEYRIRRVSDKAERWISSEAQALFVEGKPVRLIGVSRDITQQKELERLLLEKAQLAEQLENIAASVPGVICSFRRSPDGKHSFPYVSAHFADVYGLLPEEVKDDAGPLFQHIHTDDIDHVTASIEHSIRTRRLWRDTFRYEHPSKGWIWIEGQSTPVFEPGGAIVWHGYIQDVTARKRAENELKERETRLRAFYDAGLLGVMYWEANGEISEANDKFLEMLGYNRQDLVAGRLNWIELTPPELRSRDEAASVELRASGATKRPFEKEYLCKNGERLPVLVAASALDSAVEKGVAFALDISDRKRAEEELQRLYVGRFDAMKIMAAGFAHEIMQPLTAAGAYATAARRMLDMGRAAEVGVIMEKTAAEIARAARIITRLRELVDHGEPDMLPASLHDLIRQALTDSAIATDGRRPVKLQLSAARDAVLVDKAQLVRVLVNLLRNAEEAMAASPQGGLIIATSCDDQQLQVDIIDTGSGMSPQARDDLFNPFPTMKSKSGGMGIGLSVSRAIIEAHHGRIWASPNSDCGTVVSFALPLLDLRADS